MWKPSRRFPRISTRDGGLDKIVAGETGRCECAWGIFWKDFLCHSSIQNPLTALLMTQSIGRGSCRICPTPHLSALISHSFVPFQPHSPPCCFLNIKAMLSVLLFPLLEIIFSRMSPFSSHGSLPQIFPPLHKRTSSNPSLTMFFEIAYPYTSSPYNPSVLMFFLALATF